jgi:protein associated with RNAse G/E
MHSDGSVHRWWPAVVEWVTGREVSTIAEVGTYFDGPPETAGFRHRFWSRMIYWTDRPYNLMELYEPDGRFFELYANVAGPATIEGKKIQYTDLELDVVKKPKRPARIVDEDEFEAAAQQYGYAPEFQRCCREAAEEARELLERWAPLGMGMRRRPPPRARRG